MQRRDALGPKAIGLLVITGVVGLALGVHGWSARGSGQTPGALTGQSPSPRAAAPQRSPSGTPTAGASTGAASRGRGTTAGPLLSSQSYASYAFQVWPGRPSSAARAAMTGLVISVRRTAAGLSVSAGVRGQSRPAPRTYPGGARVYVIEASMGDEGGNADYNLGDDGLVVTDVHGRILR